MIGQMVIAMALPGFYNLGCSVTHPYFSFQKQILFTIISTLSKNKNKNPMWEVKKISRFLPMVHMVHGILPSCGCKARETMVTKCELVI